MTESRMPIDPFTTEIEVTVRCTAGDSLAGRFSKPTSFSLKRKNDGENRGGFELKKGTQSLAPATVGRDEPMLQEVYNDFPSAFVWKMVIAFGLR